MVNCSKRGRSNNPKDHRKVSVDRISLLPDELLGFILSFLTLKEAAATSILSKRWNKYLWLLTPKLDLDGTDSLRKVKMESPPLKKEYHFRHRRRYHDRDRDYDYDYDYDYGDHDRDRGRSGENESSPLEKGRRNYVRWVDSVVAKHECTHRARVEEFVVSFDLSSSHADWIDAWLSYALRKKVERLELNLIDVINVDTNCSKYDESLYKYPKKKTSLYSFPYKKGDLPNNFKLVKKLCMHSVNVTGEAVEFFLANCLLLEQVSVSESPMLSSLKIIETSPKFKCLEISSCHNLISVEIRDSNVVTLKYDGKWIHFLLVNVPCLTELWVRVGCLTNVVGMFASVLPQLEMLKIYFTYELSLKDSKKFVSAVEMFNLKQMVVTLENGYDDDRADSLSSLIDLIGASPCLQRFVLEAPHQHIQPEKLEEDAPFTREMLKMIPRAYFCLKEVEFVGYRGVVNQLKTILHFMDNGVALENIIVDPRCFKLCSYRPWDRISRNEIDDEIVARSYAKTQLMKMFVDSKINVKIL